MGTIIKSYFLLLYVYVKKISFDIVIIFPVVMIIKHKFNFFIINYRFFINKI
jgi:hypothetical protein